MKLAFTLLLLLISPLSAMAADNEFNLVIANHQFQPAELHVPAGQRIKLIVDNRDASAEEFESYELNREKLIPASTRTFVYIGPLKTGHYPFFGDFHQQTARGVVVAD